MIIEGDYFTEPKPCPSVGTIAEICERFTAAGLPCRAQQHDEEVWIIFAGRKSRLVLTVNASGRPLTATMPEETDYDAEFACVIFEVFDNVGWRFMPNGD